MASRIPRRNFGPSLVVTLATLPLGAGCGHKYVNPPPPDTPDTAPTTEPTHEVTPTNPPRPEPTNVAPPSEPTTKAPPEPKPEPRVDLATWSLSKSGASCEVRRKVDCPSDPNETCNPPPPQKYACPAGFSGQSGYEVRRIFADGECTLHVPIHCPPGALCNPPRPKTVDCPK